VIKTVTGEEVTQAQLGGTEAHCMVSGVAHFACASDQDCLASIRRLLTFLPSNNTEDPPWQEPSDDHDRVEPSLNVLIPADPNLPYDMKDVIYNVVDDKDFLEVQPLFARNLIVGFARLAGHPIGIVANQPSVLAGTLDIDSSVKGARFVRFCDAFNIPLVVFEDVPGFLPGVSQEHGGIIRHGAKLLFAFAEATVPKLTVITRKAYGGAYCVMASKHIRADVNFAFPTAEIAVMGPEGAVEILFGKQFQQAPGDREELKKARVAEFREKLANPYVAAERGYIDEVIEPSRTRPKLIRALEMCANKRDTNPPRKHGNIPL